MISTIVSIVALVVAALALGWNIYRDVVLRARVKVRLAVVQIISGSEGVAASGPSYIRLLVTNLGPGPVQIDGIAGMIAPWWRRLFRGRQYFVVLQDHTNPLSTQLPRRLQVGENATVLLPHEQRSFLNGAVTHFGVSDSFGRAHYAPKRDLRESKKHHRKDFPHAQANWACP